MKKVVAVLVSSMMVLFSSCVSSTQETQESQVASALVYASEESTVPYYMNQEMVEKFQYASKTEAHSKDLFQLESFKVYAYRSLAEGNFESATLLLQSSAQEGTSLDHEAFMILGISYLMLQEEEMARSSFEQASVLNPRAVEPSLNMGLFYLNKGHFTQAELYLKRAYQQGPQNPTVNLFLGELMVHQKNFKEAASYLQIAYAGLLERGDASYYLGLVEWNTSSNSLKTRRFFDETTQDPYASQRIKQLAQTQIQRMTQHLDKLPTLAYDGMEKE